VTTLDVGVVGVGSMGANHARVYSELSGVELVGVADVDADRAAAVAEEYDTAAMSRSALADAADAVSVAVPTQFHAEIVTQLVDAGVDMLVEKPFVDDLDVGRRLARRADEEGVIVQVGHIERFNPAVQALHDVIEDVDPIAFEARRLGPPVDRQSTDSVVMDLMIHDVDVLSSLVDADVRSVDAVSTASDQYANAQLTFDDDTVGVLTASRVTQQKVRTLTVTAADRYVEVDYIDQSVRIHRRSVPEYEKDDGDLLYRHQSVIEQPLIETAEPLREELTAFVEAVDARSSPVVSAHDALGVLETIAAIERRAERSGAVAELVGE
jgi:predicted dehydrogenase